jgi:hypothetical protein
MSYSANAIAGQIGKQGISELPGLFSAQAARQLQDIILSMQPFDKELFLTREEWEASPKTHKNTNPGPGTSILEKLEDKLAFVEENPQLKALLTELLGPQYRIYLKKLVCRLPGKNIPDWVHDIIGGTTANSLGAFIRPQYRNISYYYDVDVHQDILEWPRQPEGQKEHRLLYMYVHLGDVTQDNSPLCFFKESHRFGATPYQHTITHIAGDQWSYTEPFDGRNMTTQLWPLLGEAGHAAIWHPCLLHGSHPVKNDSIRLALRYVLARDKDAGHCLIDEIGNQIDGLPYLAKDHNPGANANKDGSFNLQDNDFTRMGRNGIAQ